MLRNQDYRFLYAHFSFAGFCENHDSLWKWTTMFGIFTGNHKDMVRCFWNNFFLFFFCEFGWNRLGKQHHRVSNRGREGQWDEVKGIRVGFSQQENRFSFSVFIRFWRHIYTLCRSLSSLSITTVADPLYTRRYQQ